MDIYDLWIKIGAKDEASKEIEHIGAGVLAKASLIADGIKAIGSAAFDTIKNVVGGAISAYTTYEQQVGGIETFFNKMSETGEKASDVVISNAKNAYKTAGMSANEYMQNVGSFATTLIQSVAKERAQAAKGDVEAQAAALDQQLANAKANYEAQYEEKKRSNDKAAQSYSDQLSDELDALKKRLNSEVSQRKEQLATELEQLKENLNAQVEERKEANAEALAAKKESLADELSQLKENLNSQVEQQKQANAEALSAKKEQLADELSQLKDSLNEQVDQQKSANQKALDEKKKELDREYDELQRSLDKQVSEVEKAQEAEVKAYQKATDERIREINREYTEKLKLVDEEKYERIKAIEDQIDALDKQTEAERRAIEERNQQQKIANLQAKIAEAETNEERVKAQQELAFYLEDIAQKQRENQRKEQKAQLQEQKQNIKDSYDAIKDALKTSQSEQTEQYKSMRADQLDVLKASNKTEIDELKLKNKDTLQAAKDGNSDIISQMQEQQKAEIEQMQKSNAAQVTEREKANAQVLTEMQKQQQAQITEMQKANAAQVTEKEKANAEALKEMQKQQAAEIAAMQKANSEQLKERETANGAIISQMQENNEVQIKAQQRNNRDLLDDFKTAQSDQLKEMKESQGKQLEQLEGFLAEQKAALEDNSFVEATYEDQIRAAQLADMAITDMSDNANKMGTNVGMIQNAYQGFAKQNFTMLDNLKLGYGGTKTEMERLLEDAEKIQEKNGNMVDYTIDSFADIVEAIHVVQQEYGVSGYSVEELQKKMEDHSLTMQDYARVAQDLYPDMENLDEAIAKVKKGVEDGSITWQDATVLLGTTAKEGTETIEGSFNTVKAAWENFLLALQGSPKEAQDALEEFVSAVEIWLGNITPVFTTVLENLIPIVMEKGDEIARRLWEAIEGAIPEEQKQRFGQIIESINGIIDVVVDLYNHKELILLFFAAFEVIPKAKGAIDVFSGALGGIKGLLGAGGGVATAASEAAGSIGTLGEVVEAGGTTFTVFEGGAAGAAGAAGELAGSIGGAEAAMGGAAAATGGLAAEITPFLGPAGLIIAAGAAILYAVGTNEELMKSIEGVVTKTDDLASDTEIQTSTIGTSWEKMQQSMETTSQQAADAVQVQTASMTSSWSTSMDQMNTDTDTKTNTLAEKIKTFAANSGVPLDEISQKFKDFAQSGGDSIDSLSSKTDSVVTATTNMEAGATPKIKSVGDSFESMKKVTDTALEAVKKKATDSLAAIAKTSNEKGTDTATKWKGNMESFRKATEVEIGTTTQKFDGLGNTLARSAGGFTLDREGTNVMRSFYNGMVEEWNANVTTFVQNIASWIKEHKGPEQYDKQLLVENGQWIMEGLSNGLENGMWAVKRTIYGVGDVIGEETTNNVDGIDGNIEHVMDRAISTTKQGMNALGHTFNESSAKIASSMANVMADIKTAIEGSFSDFEKYGQRIEVFSLTLIDEITENLSNGSKMLISAGRQIMDGLLEGLRSGFSSVQRFVSEIGPWIQRNKGPELYDRKLLIPNGSWIIDGLQKGLEGTFEHDVMPYVSNMGEMMQGAFGAPVLSPMASVLNRPTTTTQPNQQQSKNLTVILELDRVQVGRMIYNLNNEETQRVGVRLDGGAA